MPRLLDLFCGRWGWSRSFAKRGWECVGVDLVEPKEIPENCIFIQRDVFNVTAFLASFGKFDFIVASSPCEEFSKFGLRCFYPEPPYPEMGIKLFNHARELCWKSGLPWVMENVCAAQLFVGNAVNHCGPFYLWGKGVPPLMPQGIRKGLRLGKGGFIGEEKREYRRLHSNPGRDAWSGSKKRADATALVATIPPELANCVADYAERILEQREANKATNPASQASA